MTRKAREGGRLERVFVKFVSNIETLTTKKEARTEKKIAEHDQALFAFCQKLLTKEAIMVCCIFAT